MRVIGDSTVLFHLRYQNDAMNRLMRLKNITEVFITRISYLELLAGASENAKIQARKFLQSFAVLEFDAAATSVANKMSMKYRVGKKDSKDFLIAAICIANKTPLLTENDKDFNYEELDLMAYRIR
jgi:predicted nucleic acid-binding protein